MGPISLAFGNSCLIVPTQTAGLSFADTFASAFATALVRLSALLTAAMKHFLRNSLRRPRIPIRTQSEAQPAPAPPPQGRHLDGLGVPILEPGRLVRYLAISLRSDSQLFKKLSLASWRCRGQGSSTVQERTVQNGFDGLCIRGFRSKLLSGFMPPVPVLSRKFENAFVFWKKFPENPRSMLSTLTLQGSLAEDSPSTYCGASAHKGILS